MFQFTGFRSLSGVRTPSDGFPHSEIRESLSACDSSRLFAAFRVLLRLDTPGHPPYALSSFTSSLNPNVSSFFLCNSQRTLVGPGGLEPPTSRLSGVRSNRLSYGPFGDEEI